jgi:hypothetical protein
MFRPFYNDHLQASMLGGVVNTIVLRNIRYLVSRVKTAVYYHILVGAVAVNPLKTKRGPLYLKTQSVPRCKHFPSRL